MLNNMTELHINSTLFLITTQPSLGRLSFNSIFSFLIYVVAFMYLIIWPNMLH